MTPHMPSWTVCWRSLAIALIVTTPALADEYRSSDYGSAGSSDAVAYSLSDDLSDFDSSSEFVNTTATDVTYAEQAGPCTQCGASPTQSCGHRKLKALNAKVLKSHKSLYYNNNFDYLCDPGYDAWHLGDSMKRRGIGDWITVDVGGQLRFRQHSERNMRGLGLTGVDDDFLLYRTRLYGNVEFGNSVRVFAEGIDATSEFEDFKPRPIEENRLDMLNLFVDFRVLDLDQGSLWARAGRQELLYGDERVISPLDWANTRRTFEGYKMLWSGEAWDADFFYTNPMRLNRTKFDSPNRDKEFMGTYLTYKKLQNNKLDLYYLGYNNNVDNGGDFNYDTFGARLKGDWEVWMWDFEGAYQSGNFEGNNHDASFYTAGLGRNFECVKWTPTLWAYYDWASGDAIQGNGYDHMFPLAHKYLGFMDLFGRRNITDANVLLTLKPHQRVKLLLWGHVFRLQDGNDVPYNVNMSPFNPGNLPGSKDLGTEIDSFVSMTLTDRANLTIGYSYFFSGDYYSTTANAPYDGDASFLWTQFSLGF